MNKFGILLSAICLLLLSGCLTTSPGDRQYIIGYVTKSAGGIDTFREPGFLEARIPAEGYEESVAVRAVLKIYYNEDGSVARLEDVRISERSYDSQIRAFIKGLRAERASVDDLNGREHDFRVWIYDDKVVHIESSR